MITTVKFLQNIIDAILYFDNKIRPNWPKFAQNVGVRNIEEYIFIQSIYLLILNVNYFQFSKFCTIYDEQQVGFIERFLVFMSNDNYFTNTIGISLSQPPSLVHIFL